MLVPQEELAQRQRQLQAQLASGPLPYVPPSQTPWQEIQRSMVSEMSEGAVLKPAVKYRDVAHCNYPRDNH
jgi:dihydroxy-acid dehydratase